MITIEAANKNPLVIASANLTVWGEYVKDGAIARLSKSLSTIKTGVKVGVVVATYYSGDGRSFAKVQLINPVSKLLTKYTHGYVYLADVNLFGAAVTPTTNGKTYWCTGSQVNIRKSPSLTSAVMAKLDKGDIIGQSDGVLSGQFLKFNLALGGIGYVATQYCTLKSPELPVVTQPLTVKDPASGKDTTVQIPVVQPIEGSIDWLRLGVSIVASFVGGVILRKIFKKRA
ncbi:hypothetical protein SAMN04515674_104274 [Pseudarcicella hirudinis]|uniref:SH3 domain-containing protein n=1 Tax=Pseudarcicella hirudinis TaxID=1079859 RepID=A0A1I5RW65_9BACT|nr:SH3 domain-containing protein [Pseudarcicella hirudinis]SFP62637.1 hypothetical protein SAMN04515674_104274 [Pseudarcicella hirudinis]